MKELHTATENKHKKVNQKNNSCKNALKSAKTAATVRMHAFIIDSAYTYTHTHTQPCKQAPLNVKLFM